MTMSYFFAANLIKDHVLLQIPERCPVSCDVYGLSETREAGTCYATVVSFKWSKTSSVNVKEIVGRVAGNVVQRMAKLSIDHIADPLEPEKITTSVYITKPEERTAADGEPIPSEAAHLSVMIGDTSYVITSLDGVSFSILKNGKEIAGNLPSAAFAYGSLSKYVLEDLITRELDSGNKDAESELPKDFLFSVSHVLDESAVIPDEKVRRYLIDLVELTTNREFSSY